MPETFHLGHIEYFGAWGEDLSRVQQALPLHVGDTVTPDEAEEMQAKIKASVLKSYGAAATDATIVCCDAPHAITVYIGLPGDSWCATTSSKPPAGNATLPKKAEALYEQYGTAWGKAVEAGRSGEDDAHGYSLSQDADLRAVELAMRSYAVAHSTELMHVLRSSGDAEQRRAASALLGYATRSRAQMNALAKAANDPDSDVRNNSLRALEVLADAGPLTGVDLTPIALLLSSGTWSDRNKASLLLMHADLSRQPELMQVLRRSELGALLDGAVWSSAGHAYPFLAILGATEGLSEKQVGAEVKSDSGLKIIAAAKAELQHGYTQDRYE